MSDEDGFISGYDKTASSLEASISASAAPTSSEITGNPTDYVGVSGSAVTPVGGAEVGAGFYSDSNGMVGGYFSLGWAMGRSGVSLGVIKGNSKRFDGPSLNSTVGFGEDVGISRGYSFDPSTFEETGEYWIGGLTLGPLISASTSLTNTEPSDFTSLYLAYLQFLNWARYPGNSALGSHNF